jgi:transcription-repair coupling factor (superfamily II helicase)
MLEEAIAKIRSGEAEGLPGDDGQWSPQINLGVPVLIPEAYVPDLDVRLGLYRRLSQLESKVDLEGFAAELIDRFGKLPREVNTLLLVVRIKAMCKRAHIAKARCRAEGRDDPVPQRQVPQSQGVGGVRSGPEGAGEGRDNKIVVRRDWGREADKIKGAFAIARDLAQHARA